MSRVRFRHYAWGLLAFNVLVILSGAFVRATHSGDGCGNSWPTCNGSVLPELTQLKTIIEASHRLATSVLGLLTLGLVFGAFRLYDRGHPVRRTAVGVFLITVAEALIGAGLVRWKLVAQDASVLRAVVMSAHLVATFLLLMSATLTAWWASGGARLRLRGQGAMLWVLGLGLVAALCLGVTGAITALGDTLFPARTLAEGLHQKDSPTAHFLIGLRVYHPATAIATGFYLALIAGLCMQRRPGSQDYARSVVFLFMAQMGAGLLNFGLMAPIWMQLIHLLLADLFWIGLVLMTAAALSEGAEVRPVAEKAQGSPVPPAAVPELATAATKATWKDYLALTKPRVISLLLLTTLTAMYIAAGGRPAPLPSVWLALAVGLGLYMAAGAANAINMVLERDLDLRMGRTAKRPTVTAVIPAPAALRFAAALMVGSFLLLTLSANLLSALLAQAGLAFYVIVYTLLLKRRTWANIVIGGAAGAFPPLVGWAAVTGDLSPLAWTLFGIIFLWTPVHFWALALMIKEDYARAGVPMLPVVRGERATVVQIGYYAILTAAITCLPVLLRGSDGQASVGWLYLGTAAVLNAVLLWQSLQLYRRPDRPRALSLFKYSMLYLALLFLAMAVDRTTLT